MKQNFLLTMLCSVFVLAWVIGGCEDNKKKQPVPTPPNINGGFAIFSNFVMQCTEDGECPNDTNLDLFRVDFNSIGEPTLETRLTDNSDGVWEQGDVGADWDTFYALSPDGEWMVFRNALPGYYVFYRMRSDGSTEPEQISPEGAASYFLSFSADMTAMYLESDADGDWDVYRVSIDDSEDIQNITNNNVDDPILKLLPDENSAIVLLAMGGAQEDRELGVFNFSTGETIRLTHDVEFNYLLGNSADGSLLVYWAKEDIGNPDLEHYLWPDAIWAVRTDGESPPFKLTEFAKGFVNEYIGITPDNQFVLFEYRDQIKQIYAAAISETSPNVIQLTDPPAGESSFFRLLDPDKEWLLYTTNDRPASAGGSGDIELYRMNLDGTKEICLTDFDNEAWFLPDTYLKKRELLVLSSQLEGNSDVYFVPINGGELTNLTGENDPFFGDDFQAVTPDEYYLLYSNMSDNFIVLPNGDPSSLNDADIYITPIGFDGPTFQLTKNSVGDQVRAVFTY